METFSFLWTTWDSQWTFLSIITLNWQNGIHTFSSSVFDVEESVVTTVFFSSINMKPPASSISESLQPGSVGFLLCQTWEQQQPVFVGLPSAKPLSLIAISFCWLCCQLKQWWVQQQSVWLALPAGQTRNNFSNSHNLLALPSCQTSDWFSCCQYCWLCHRPNHWQRVDELAVYSQHLFALQLGQTDNDLNKVKPADSA